MDIPQIVAGRFRIEREIGRGGMGTVYRALHLGLERAVAVKVLKKEFAADPEVAERFMREARTMSRLRHPRAAMIFDAGRLADGRPFIVMEHVEGATLADALASQGPFKPERAVRIATEMCDVLAEAHSLGIVHRDLKPSNIMLTERGVVVLDFGIAKVLATAADAARTHATTESGLIIGTPRYMSPEQCMGRRVVPASDLYSVGVLVYEMLTGRPPFVDALPSAVLVKQATAAPPPLLSLRADAPRPLALVVHTLLAKSPDHRPRTADEARTLLERSIAEPARPRDESEQPFASTITFLNAGRFTFIRFATACAILAMLGAVLLAWAKNGGAQAAAGSSVERDLRDGMPGRLAAGDATARPAQARPTQARPAPARFVPPAQPAPPPAPTSPPPALTTEAAWALAASAARGAATDVRVVRTASGAAIAAIHDGRDQKGYTHLFIMERGEGAAGFRTTARVPLDVRDFRGARWSQEVTDLDGDGYDEVLCTGVRGRGAGQGRRFVLYVPRTRQVYSLRVAPDARANGSLRTTWSPNAERDAAEPFRLALRRRASTQARTL